jgi:transcriptional regulator with XRE-family HTH domain
MRAEIGKRIKKIREDMNMTKESFAKLLGISGQHLGIVERGKSHLSIEKLKVLCDITNLSADYILFGKDDNLKSNTKEILSEFTDEQLQTGCNALKELALFIKNS